MIYFDHAATSKIDSFSLSVLQNLFIDNFANTSSPHIIGQQQKKLLDEARQSIATSCNITLRESIYFSNSASTAANILLQGYCDYLTSINDKRNEIIISEIEHPCVYNTALFLQTRGFIIRKAKIDINGQVDKDHLRTLLGSNTAIVAIMAVNNEVGSIQNIPELVQLVKEFNSNIFFISDFVQGIGKLPTTHLTDVDAWFIAGHKIGAPKGVACFYLNPSFRINPILFGGGQENGLQPGTMDSILPSILANSIHNNINSFEEMNQKYHTLRTHLINMLEANNIQHTLVISPEFSIPSILSICFDGISGHLLASYLEKKEIYVSTRSACSSFCFSESHVIRALQIKKNKKLSPIRISFSHHNEIHEIESFITVLKEILNVSR